ncbi:MAG: hypothetical protein WBO09_19845, partial [Methylocystis silviterrae]
EPDTDVLYQMSRPFVGGQARGLRYDDPGFAISWPALPAVIGEVDLAWASPWTPSPGTPRSVDAMTGGVVPG